MIVDAHHHLWDPAKRDYPWMTGDAAVLARAYDLGDLCEAMAATPIEMTVVVQTVSDSSETRELLAVAAESEGLITGVVGWVDLLSPDVEAALDDIMAAKAGSLFVGVRHQVHDEDDPHWLLRDDVLRGLRAVRDVGLVFDLLVRSRELPFAIQAVDLLPELQFVLDHIGKPAIVDATFEPWAGLVSQLAARPNVSCKLSGLVTEAAPHASASDFRRYSDHVIGAFGTDRVMFGSDWPVCTLRTSYQGAYDLAVELLGALTIGERDAVLGDNAAKTYGLG